MAFDPDEKEYLGLLVAPLKEDLQEIKDCTQTQQHQIDENTNAVTRLDERTNWLEGLWWKVGAVVLTAIVLGGLGIASGAVP